MIDLRDEILIDFITEAEDYYQVVQQAMSTIRGGDTQQGVAAMMRPLHTIKGTSGFIAGLEKLKTYTHQVEDILKQIQGEQTQPSTRIVDCMIRSVDEVFNLIDQIKRGNPELDDQDAQTTLSALRQAINGDSAGPSSSWFPPRILGDKRAESNGTGQATVSLQVMGGVLLIKVLVPRLHLPWQCSLLAESVGKADPNYPVAINLEMVRTVSSTVWGEIWQASQGHQVVLIGLRPAVEATYKAWGLDSRMRAYPDEAAFWQNLPRVSSVTEAAP